MIKNRMYRRIKDNGKRELFTITVYDKSQPNEWNIKNSPYSNIEFYDYDDAVRAAHKAVAEHSANGGDIEAVIFGGEYVDNEGRWIGGDPEPIEYITDSRHINDGLDEPLPYTDEHPATDWEYWGVKETTLKQVKNGDWFTLKPIPEPKESQVWIKGDYNRSDRDYTCERYDGGGERFFKANRKVYVDFYF